VGKVSFILGIQKLRGGLSIYPEIHRMIPTLQIVFGSYCFGTAGIPVSQIPTPPETWMHVCVLLDCVF